MKVKTLKEAVSLFIHDNCHISFGGFTVSRQPMACAYEMIRQGKKNLHVYIHSGGQALDILIGAGCVKAVEIAYGANGRFAPTCVRFRKAVGAGIGDRPMKYNAVIFVSGILIYAAGMKSPIKSTH